MSDLDAIRARAAGTVATTTTELFADVQALLSRLDTLTEALERITDPSYVGNYDTERVVNIYRAWARNALSRVSRSEPAPPEDVCSWCDQHGVCDPGNCPMRPAPPVPEEQQ